MFSKSEDDIQNVISIGDMNRSVGFTKMNSARHNSRYLSLCEGFKNYGENFTHIFRRSFFYPPTILETKLAVEARILKQSSLVAALLCNYSRLTLKLSLPPHLPDQPQVRGRGLDFLS